MGKIKDNEIRIRVPGAIVGFFACLLWGFSYAVLKCSDLLTVWFSDSFLGGQGFDLISAVIVAVFYMLIAFISFLLIASSIISTFHGKTLFESIRYQLYKYFAAYALLPMLLFNQAWVHIYHYLPAAKKDLAPFAIESITSAAAKALDYIYIVVLLWVLASAFCYVFGICINSNIVLNIVSVVPAVVYLYLLICAVACCPEYAVKLLIPMVPVYAVIIVNLLYMQGKRDTPLLPVYEVLLVRIEEPKSDTALTDTPDFSIFLPRE